MRNIALTIISVNENQLSTLNEKYQVLITELRSVTYRMHNIARQPTYLGYKLCQNNISNLPKAFTECSVTRFAPTAAPMLSRHSHTHTQKHRSKRHNQRLHRELHQLTSFFGTTNDMRHVTPLLNASRTSTGR